MKAADRAGGQRPEAAPKWRRDARAKWLGIAMSIVATTGGLVGVGLLSGTNDRTPDAPSALRAAAPIPGSITHDSFRQASRSAATRPGLERRPEIPRVPSRARALTAASVGEPTAEPAGTARFRLRTAGPLRWLLSGACWMACVLAASLGVAGLTPSLRLGLLGGARLSGRAIPLSLGAAGIAWVLLGADQASLGRAITAFGEDAAGGRLLWHLRPERHGETALLCLTAGVALVCFSVSGFMSGTALGVPLRTAAAPTGIVGLELAWSGARAVAILDSWGEDGCVAARGSLWVDFAFIPAYVAGLGLLTALAARAWSDPRPVLPAMVGPVAIGPPATGLAVGLIYGLALAGLLDVAENAALSRMLARYDPERTDGGVSDRLAAFAAFCAAVKFALIAVALLYLVGGALLGLGRLR